LKKNRQKSGFTLVEVMFTLVIASVFFVSFLYIYIFGIEQFNASSMKYKMCEETAWVLEQMEEIIWVADTASISSSRLKVRIPDTRGDGFGCGWIEFFVNGRDHTLRMNDSRTGYNNFNQQILPVASKQTIRRFGARKQPFRVIDFQYEFIDDYKYSIKIDLTVEDLTADDDDDDENKLLKLSTTAFMENRLN